MNVVVLLPFSNYIVKLAYKLVPINEEEEDEKLATTKFLDDRMLETPSIALSNTVDEIIRMASRSTRSLNYAYDSIKSGSDELRSKSFDYEQIVNSLQYDITNFLFKLTTRNLSDAERIKTDVLFHIVNDIERVGDHAENIAEISQELSDKNVVFSEEAIKELDLIFDIASNNFYDSITAIKTNNLELAETVAQREKKVDLLEQSARNSHMARLHEESCSVEAGIYFLDIISNLERISDHSKNIVEEMNRMQGHI